MAAKIQLNFGKIGTFGGIFSTIDAFRKAGLSNLIDNTLGNKGINTKYAYSHIVENLMSTYLCGGECSPTTPTAASGRSWSSTTGGGRSERTFDMMNNDFGWKHLPCSFMQQNTVFVILTAPIGNFFAFPARRVAESGNFGIEATSRAKRFLFNFIQVPFRWTHSGRRWLLQIYSDRPYDKLKL